uniref:Homer 2 n=1 Tax=Aceria tosichella TaxID=561515 RepID=A0A6G1SKC1_9ACAR
MVIELYSNKAHVFQINTETKNSWLAKGDSAIPISLVQTVSNDPSTAGQRELRIFAMDETGKTVLDCLISPKTVFNKRSQKFGQWTDPTGMIYGLGFNSEVELNEFVESFQQLQREIFQPAGDHSVSSAALSSQQPTERAEGWIKTQQEGQQISNNSSEINDRDCNATTTAKGVGMGNPSQYSSTLSQQSVHQPMRRQQPMPENDTNNNGMNGNGARYPRSQSMFGVQPKHGSTGRLTPETESSPVSQTEWQVKEQLKYENERLKQALEESSKNAGVWQSELLNLRTNNVKLTQALQESKAHVEEWERELLNLRDENKELKLRVMALESAEDPEKTNEYKVELQKYKNYIAEVQQDLRKKENEIEDLQQSLAHLELKNNSRDDQNGRSDDPTSVEVAISLAQKQRFDQINAKLDTKINELVNIQKEYAQLADKLYH